MSIVFAEVDLKAFSDQQKLAIGGGVTLAVIGLLILLYFGHRCSKNRRSRKPSSKSKTSKKSRFCRANRAERENTSERYPARTDSRHPVGHAGDGHERTVATHPPLFSLSPPNVNRSHSGRDQHSTQMPKRNGLSGRLGLFRRMGRPPRVRQVVSKGTKKFGIRPRFTSVRRR